MARNKKTNRQIIVQNGVDVRHNRYPYKRRAKPIQH